MAAGSATHHVFREGFSAIFWQNQVDLRCVASPVNRSFEDLTMAALRGGPIYMQSLSWWVIKEDEYP